MSGIVGILRGRGAPICGEVLRKLTAALAFRGPNAQHTWLSDSCGLGFTLLRTIEETEGEEQPLCFDGNLYVVAGCTPRRP